MNEEGSELPELEAFEQRLTQLQAKLADLKEMASLEQVPPEQWVDLQEQLAALEERMKTYLDDVNPLPMLFWQVVRFGGAGMLIGVALQRWLGG